jgi:hypothetical protein
MKIRVFRNDPVSPRLKVAHLPVRQTLIWLGPWFILVKRGPR